LKPKYDISQLNSVPITEVALRGNRVIVDPGLFGRGLAVLENEAVAGPLDEGMAFFHAHVPKEGDIDAFVPAEGVLAFE
jgi:hypothetical protein